MRYGTHTLAIPRNAEYSVPQLKTLLKEVEQIMVRKISLQEWRGLS
ncbi:MAG: type II toxin-antitoxin system HicA family toxin [Dehalococcoidia bacterium]|nr:type II toxin-antitoxin system HicA family toxin [Dehalococcoidia bacterium]